MRHYILLFVGLLSFTQLWGNGSISSAKDFVEFAQAVKSKGDLSKWSDVDGVVKLSADIDLGKAKFTQISEFSGVFDGQGHSIKNWKATSGLFGRLGKGGVIRNLVIDESCSLKGTQKGETLAVGLIADHNYGTIEYCHNYAPVTYRVTTSAGTASIGALVGNNYYIVQNCQNDGEIKVTGDQGTGPSSDLCVGGIYGSNTDSPSTGVATFSCTNRGKIQVSACHAYVKVGGIIGFTNRASVVRCLNYGEITASNKTDANDEASHEMIGGIVGGCKSNMANCHNFGRITGRSNVKGNYGGIIGYIHGIVIVGDCSNRAELVIRSTKPVKVGGIIGVCSRPSFIKENINMANITYEGVSKGELSAIGGICGQVYAPKSALKGAYINGCRNSGNIKAGSGENTYESYRAMHVGGICGIFTGKSNAEIGTAKYCVNTGTITAESGRTGGLFGQASQVVVLDCENQGEVKSSGYTAGGVAALASGATIERCVNKADITSGAGLQAKAGGIVGSMWYEDPCMVLSSASSGTIRGAFGYAGVIVGQSNSDDSMVDGCLIGGAVGVSNSRDAAQITSQNFERYITGQNKENNLATVGLIDPCRFLNE